MKLNSLQFLETEKNCLKWFSRGRKLLSFVAENIMRTNSKDVN